jgi:hypothetical protein
MLSNKPKWLQRLVVIVGAAIVALIARTIAVSLFDVHFFSYNSAGQRESLDVGIRPVVVVPLTAGLIGWLALEIVERVAKAKAGATWLMGALTVYIVTLVPLFPWDMPAKTKVTLVTFHTLVAAFYVPLMARTVRAIRK